MTQSAAQQNPMAELSRKLDVCAPLLSGSVVYLDYPFHGNVGDLLIWRGTEQFFARHNINVKAKFSHKLGEYARKVIEKCDTICFHGGGNFGDIYPAYHQLRLRIISQFPRKRIVIFPQTVHFSNEMTLQADSEIFRRHPDLHIFLRDKNSLAKLQKYDLPNLALCPDMAHALWTTFQSKSGGPGTSLYLLRRDEEKTELPADVLQHRNEFFDWPDLLRKFDNAACYKIACQIYKLEGICQSKASSSLLYAYWSWFANKLIAQSQERFNRHERIVSNRLHAMIFAALLQKQARIYDNSYGKVSSYASLWLQDVPGIQIIY